MALTMVHLLVAERWARGHAQYADCPEFYLGVISPDAIHIRDKNDKSHKNEIHLNNWVSPHPEDVMAYWRKRHAPFDVGYGVHVLTDGQWVPRFRQQLPGIILPNGLLDTGIYYNDTFVTDFQLYRETKNMESILRAIEMADVPEDHPLLTRYELDEWRKVILQTYRGKCPKHDPVRFIDENYVRAFVEDSIELIDKVYEEGFK